MNGKRILRRLIWLFLGINIILLLFNYGTISNEYKLSDERIQNIEDVLKKQGISIETRLPERFSPKPSATLNFKGAGMRYTIEKNFFGKNLVSVKHFTGESEINPGSQIKVRYCSFDKETLAFDGNVIKYTNQQITRYNNSINADEARKMCDILLKRIDPEVKHKYAIETKKEKNYWEITYYPLLENIPVLDSSLSFKVCDEGVIDAKIHLADIENISVKKEEIYPVDLVLFGLLDEIKGQSHKITDIEMVYKRLSEEDNMWGQQIAPMYKITLDGLEEPVFVNAYTNEIIK